MGVGIWYGTSRDSNGYLSDLETEHTNGFKAKASHTHLTDRERKDPKRRMRIAKDILSRIPLIDG